MSDTSYENQLRNIFNNINDWLKFAEAKNFGLLTLCSACIFGFTQTDLFSTERVYLTIVFILFNILSLLCSLLSLFPILTQIEKGDIIKSWITKLSQKIDKENTFENIHFYGYLRNLSKEEFQTEFLKKIGGKDPLNGYEEDLVNQILYNSRITWLKYQLFKIGAFIFGLGLIASLIVGVATFINKI